MGISVKLSKQCKIMKLGQSLRNKRYMSVMVNRAYGSLYDNSCMFINPYIVVDINTRTFINQRLRL